ncbi:hypothetical protein BU24DRAFT_479739 [Aaosphaeria arxii CBS 175.79]|uniref:BTB domain-containing protein n=1 Tax=Aaosphaeria arxii CBS 175.79 TaxID=1450172 RepID=A0A6A5Y0K5_9PLEO|nr:uncharacterized protein BU24DRAFT_479739 [Aaosphaeria arxii CBS 175.79]KAF2018330.1 hypothetical protein BU24DRAFT_479739 [Aaosphaeria arxii CBS 175.79]
MSTSIAHPSKRPTIQVYISGNRQFHTFVVHKDVLVRSSPKWRNTLATRPDAKDIIIENVDPTIFNIYVQWIYSRNDEITTLRTDSAACLTDAYLLGVKLGDKGFQKFASNKLLDFFTTHRIVPGVRFVNIFYELSKPGSAERLAVLDLWVESRHDAGKKIKSCVEDVHREFRADFVKALSVQTEGPVKDQPWVSQPDIFHMDALKAKEDVKAI